MKPKGWLALIFILFWVIGFVFFNIPDGYIIAGSDYYQLINYLDLSNRYLYAWINQVGQGTYNTLFVTYPFYLFLGILNLFLPSNLIASWMLFSSLSLFFISFYISSKVLAPKLSLEIRAVSSLIYAMNNFVISMHTYPWGFTHHFLIYIFFPLLMSLFIKIFIQEKNNIRNIIYFFTILLMATPSFNNPAFFVLLIFAQFLAFIALLLVGLIRINMKLTFKVLTILAIYILISSSYLIPFAEYTSIDISQFNTSHTLGGENYVEPWLRKTSSNFINSFLFAMDNYRHPFFEISHQYIFILTSSLYFILFILLLLKSFTSLQKKSEANKLLLVFVFLLLFFTLLSVRLNTPFDFISKKIYLFPLFLAFRSPDKIFLAIPFFFSISIALMLSKLKRNTLPQLLKLTLFLLTIPFLLQVIPQFLKGDYNRYAKKTSPEYSYIVSIPKEYKDIKTIIDEEDRNSAIVSLPYSVVNSINWANYPKWHLVGHDILHILYDKRYISANSFDNPQSENLFSFRNYNESEKESEELLNIIEKFGGEYVIAHKDIDKTWINKSEKVYLALDDLTNKKYVSKVESNEFFDLYKLRPDKVQPLLSTNKGELTFQKINNSKYRLQIKSANVVTLKFLQTYDPNWKIYVSRKNDFPESCSNINSYLNGRVRECDNKNIFFEGDEFIFQKEPVATISHTMCEDYANCWELNGSKNSTIELILYYRSQNYVYLHYAVYAIGIVFVSTYFIILYGRKKKS